MILSTIRFGTSGWRGLIARDFTFENVRLATRGIALYLQAELQNPASPSHGRKPVVILGYDTRFLGREFSLAAAEVLTNAGLTPLLCNRDVPTPVIAHNIRARKANGGINMTASHNPAEYQGLKFSTYNGAPATPEVTHQIEARIAQLQSEGWSMKSAVVGTFECQTFDPMPSYFQQIRKLIPAASLRAGTCIPSATTLPAATTASLPMTARGSTVAFMPMIAPSPIVQPSSTAQWPTVTFAPIVVGQSTPTWITALSWTFAPAPTTIGPKSPRSTAPNQILALALYHLKKNRKWTGAVVRTVPTSHQVDAVAELLGVPLHETPVGFKYIGALMETEPIIVGGEESGGLSVKGHVPEKDGILACLLMAELVATERKSLGQILKALEKQTGEFHTERINVAIPPEKKESLLARLASGLKSIGPFKVEKFITTDGFKFLLPNREWVAFRASGTEPVVRCYIEAKSAAGLKKLRKTCQELLAS